MSTDNLHNRIKELRILKGWNQEEMSQKIGIRQGNYSKYEKATVPDPYILLRIARALDTTMEYLLEGLIIEDKKTVIAEKLQKKKLIGRKPETEL